jgi:hypothetical protein
MRASRSFWRLVPACAVAFALIAGSVSAQQQTNAGQLKTPEPSEDVEKHSSFLKWVHFDVLWLPTSTDNDALGIIGTHLAVAQLGRIWIGPPGVLLVRVPTERGRTLRPAFTWGFSVHIADVQMPRSRHTARLFLNLAKVTTHGEDFNSGMDMGGLSVSWKD